MPLAAIGFWLSARGRQGVIRRLDEPLKRTLVKGDEHERRRDGMVSEAAARPSLGQKPVIAAQAVDLLMGTFGAVVLKKHRLARLCAAEDQRRIGLYDAFARASVEEAREHPSASLRFLLGPLLLARVDLATAWAVPGKWHLIEQWALAGACSVREVKDERVDLQVVLYVGDAVDVRRLVELALSGHPVV